MFTLRNEPFAEINRIRNELDRMFGRSGAWRPRCSNGANAYPPLDMWEDDDSLYVEAELPGFELDDLEIYVTGGNQLSIKGERKVPELSGGTWHRRERGFGSLNRMIRLEHDVDSDNVSADFANGVLTITLPKAAEARPRRIEVKSK